MSSFFIAKSILHVLRCPNCDEDKIAYQSDKLYCENCAKEYPVTNNVPELMPTTSLREPAIYQDEHFRQWVNHIDHEYYYGSGEIISYIQNAGHRAIRRMRKNTSYHLMLDLGCGDGAHIPYLDSIDHYIGIDLDRTALERLKCRSPEFFVLHADAYTLPLADSSINCIANIYNLEHMVYLDLALEEMTRVIAPEGDIFISVPHVGGFLWDTGSKLTSQKDLSTEHLDFHRVVEISHINCIWQLEKAFKRYFTIKKISRFPFHIPASHLNLVSTYHCMKR